jgi:hypothetical protein
MLGRIGFIRNTQLKGDMWKCIPINGTSGIKGES